MADAEAKAELRRALRERRSARSEQERVRLGAPASLGVPYVREER